MGHTERMNGRYATFVEAVIPVGDMEFYGSIPKWNSKIWGNVFREIKRIYEEMIIVGWAMDIKGMAPKMTQELERVHREHFGGVHQLLLLMDSLEKEETFYNYRESRLAPQEGFYIYYRSKVVKTVEEVQKAETVNLELEIPERHILENSGKTTKRTLEPNERVTSGGQYRELLRAKQMKEGAENSNVGIAVAVALLMFVIGVGAYENKDRILGNDNIPAIEETGYMSGADTETEAAQGTEDTVGATDISSEEVASYAAEAGYTIPVERVSGENSEEE